MDKSSSIVIWFTGLPCSGKTTLAKALFERLKARGGRVEHLDGDVVRSVFSNTGFSEEARNRHVRQMGFLASRLEAHGVHVVASFVSPYQSSRDFVRALCQNFVEIHVSTPLQKCEDRDVKGMYAKARAGEISSFTGLDAPYEKPTHCELTIDTSDETVEESVEKILTYLTESNRL